MKPASSSSIVVDEAGPQNFTLAVMFDGRRFECGSYISRAAAMQRVTFFCNCEIRDKCHMPSCPLGPQKPKP